MKGKRTTMADIAQKSGYSKAAVSFAFNEPHKISKEAYDKIMSVANELDYVPDPMARNLSIGKHMVIGFLLPQKLEFSMNNPYTVGVIRGIGEICEEHGYTLNLIPPLHSSIPEAVKKAMVDGIITMGLTVDLGIQDVLRQRHMPVVTIDGAASEGVASVNIDDEKAAHDIMTAALKKGHRDFAIISLSKDAYAKTGNNRLTTSRKRFIGYERALWNYGLKIEDMLLLTSEPTFEEGLKCADEIFNNTDRKVTCIVCMADIIALGVMKKAMEKKIVIPDDCSIIGFDGIADSQNMFLPLTTIEQPAETKGKVAAQALFNIINAPDSAGSIQHMVPYRFIENMTLSQRKNR